MDTCVARRNAWQTWSKNYMCDMDTYAQIGMWVDEMYGICATIDELFCVATQQYNATDSGPGPILYGSSLSEQNTRWQERMPGWLYNALCTCVQNACATASSVNPAFLGFVVRMYMYFDPAGDYADFCCDTSECADCQEGAPRALCFVSDQPDNMPPEGIVAYFPITAEIPFSSQVEYLWYTYRLANSPEPLQIVSFADWLATAE